MFDIKREKGIRVLTSDIKRDALKISERDKLPKFKASNHWLNDFKQRNEIRWKKITNFKIKTEEQMFSALKMFYQELSLVHSEESIDPRCIVNFDETRVEWGLMSSYTLDYTYKS